MSAPYPPPPPHERLRSSRSAIFASTACRGIPGITESPASVHAHAASRPAVSTPRHLPRKGTGSPPGSAFLRRPKHTLCRSCPPAADGSRLPSDQFTARPLVPAHVQPSEGWMPAHAQNSPRQQQTTAEPRRKASLASCRDVYHTESAQTSTRSDLPMRPRTRQRAMSALRTPTRRFVQIHLRKNQHDQSATRRVYPERCPLILRQLPRRNPR